MRDKALVLSGGGAKGAYEIGVWKALDQKQLVQRIGFVSGTSVGALNAALFVQGDLKEALHMWEEIQNEHILTPKNVCEATSLLSFTKEEKRKLCLFLQKEKNCAVFQFPLLNYASTLVYKRILGRYLAKLDASLTVHLAKALVPCFLNILVTLKISMNFEMAILETISIMKNILQEGLFSQQGLESILDEHLNVKKILSSPIKLYATAYNLTKLKKEDFYFQASLASEFNRILLASSAIPFIFDQIRIKDDIYIDGGIPIVGDNTPIDVAYQKGYRDIIVVVLNANEVEVDKYKGANITVVQPETSLGSSLASLDFDNEYTKQLIQRGYKDALKKI